MNPKQLNEFQAWLKKQADEARKRGSVYFDGRAGAYNDAFEYLAILLMQSTGAPVQRLGLRRVVLEKIASDAMTESGGDAEESVSIAYSLLLELIDGYRASGWVRDMPPNATGSSTTGAQP